MFHRSRFVLALFLLAALPGMALAAGSPPRGPGFYFSLGKLAVIVCVYFGWISTCVWVSKDAKELELPAEPWNLAMVCSGIGGLLLVWALPWFFLSFPLLLACYLMPLVFFVIRRNEGLPPEDKILTPRHLKYLASRFLHLNFGSKHAERGRQIPLRFIGKTTTGQDDVNRVERAQQSRGYRAALEMVYEAIEQRVTDIHMEPSKDEMSVRFRVDGVLEQSAPFSRQMGDAVLNIFKVLAALDITEKRKPQDGSFSAEVMSVPKPRDDDATVVPRPAAATAPAAAGGAGTYGLVPDAPSKGRAPGESSAKNRIAGESSPRHRAAPPTEEFPSVRQIDFRVATAGSVAGEKLVMRILDRARSVVTLTQVGMREKIREQVKAVVKQPHGMFIVCGPTGAGKSTTLYACLSEIDRYAKNVITIENPVEYQIDNVTQIEVNPKAGKTFASELRSILRQDPDVIYIGEIRDNETAEIACQAAQTGHMVLTTLHANDTVTAIGRLLDLGVQPFMIANAVSAVLGQRLVRVLCPKCKQKYTPNPETIRKANLPADKIKFFYRPPPGAGTDEAKEANKCPRCNATGYRGRTGVFELLVMTDKLRDMVRENPNLNAIRQEAIKNGMQHLQDDGLRQVIEGETSIQEVMRVCK
jgi:type II secretory ATPase GspE/PulE/Tfp pilus assembly ATPase PilB-like protein